MLAATIVVFPPDYTRNEIDPYVSNDLASAVDTVWRIRMDGFGDGSGVVVASHLQVSGESPTKTRFRVLILTAAHVTDLAEKLPFTVEITAELKGNTLRDGHVVSGHSDEDASIIEFFSVLPVMVAQIDEEEPILLDILYSVGYAGGQGDRWISNGLSSGYSRTTCKGAPGDSGGAIFNAQGKLVGIINTLGQLWSGQLICHHIKYAALTDLSEWLDEHLVSDTLYYSPEEVEEDQTLLPDHPSFPEGSELPETEPDEKRVGPHGPPELELQPTPTLSDEKGF